MTGHQKTNELIVLSADKNMEFALRGILSRVNALKIREVESTYYVHPESDPGCLLRGHELIKPFVNRFSHALLLLDREGSGKESSTREALEAEIEERLARSGWGNRAAAIVIDPELEMWVWSDSPHVDSVLGWKGKDPDLRTWLRERGFLKHGQIKPDRPKEAMEQALRTARKARSSACYIQLAQNVSLERCTDPAFNKLKSVLQKWFPASDERICESAE